MSNIKTYLDPATVASGFAEDFAVWLNAFPANKEKITVALSGGSTPKILFRHWANDYRDSIDWSRVHFFWGDERCVPPADSESNFGVAKELFLDRAHLDAANIHRVHGESNPADERVRYEQVIKQHVAADTNGLPQFDLIMLGMGDDGHTASIFPHEMQFMTSKNICEVATHPESGQKRITLTGPVLNAAQQVSFLITGENKADVLEQIINKHGDFQQYPASHVTGQNLTFYLDQSAAEKLKRD